MTKKNYPPRLYFPGKSPLQKPSFNHNCHLSDFRKMKDAVGEEVFNDIMNTSQVGVILKLASSNYIWAAKTVHSFLTHQIAVNKKYEMWSLIGGRPLRFSLHEFKEITHLNCDMIDGEDKWDIDHTEFWKEMGVNIGDGPTWFELQKVFVRCRTWSYEKRKMIGLLFILSVGIYGINRHSRIPLMAAKRVLDLEAFERYPWGRESFHELIISIKVASLRGYTYTVHGCVHALLIWAYESVPILGEKFGNRKESVEIPLLRWGSSKKRDIKFDDVLEEEKKTTKDNKVRVKHLLPKPLDEIYPVWLDETNDKKLDNMIRDILNGNLDESFWDTSKAAAEYPKRKAKKAKKAHKESELDVIEKSDQILKLLKNLHNKIVMLNRTQSRVSRVQEEMERNRQQC